MLKIGSKCKHAGLWGFNFDPYPVENLGVLLGPLGRGPKIGEGFVLAAERGEGAALRHLLADCRGSSGPWELQPVTPHKDEVKVGST